MHRFTITRALCVFLMASTLTGYASSAVVPVDKTRNRKVLLVSMDGFRHDYFLKANTFNFDAVKETGVHVPYVNNTFVTKTFPCHTTIATGRYEESHGIIDNDFYDPLYNKTFSMNSTEPFFWNAAEPIWINAVNSGLKVGTFFWPGSDVSHNGVRPTTYQLYDESVPFETRVDAVVGWLTRDGYDFATLYFNEPDSSGHRFGPEDPQMIPVIERMDSVLGYLMKSLEMTNAKDKVDVIVTSDHGMTSIDIPTRTIDIMDFVDSSLLETAIPGFGSSLNLIPKPNKSQEIVDALAKVEHMHVYMKEDIPEHYHYGHNRRVMPVFVFADEGWVLTTNKTEARSVRKKGGHGYDNRAMDMKPIFVASGPSFKQGYKLPGPIKQVDIYPLLCYLLDLTPAPNNGSLDRVMPLLRSSSEIITGTTETRKGETTTDSPDDGSRTGLSLFLLFTCIMYGYLL